MEYCDAGTLRRAIDAGLFHRRLPGGRVGVDLPAVLRVLCDVGDALVYLHALRLLHCDVKGALWPFVSHIVLCFVLCVCVSACSFGCATAAAAAVFEPSPDTGARKHAQTRTQTQKQTTPTADNILLKSDATRALGFTPKARGLLAATWWRCLLPLTPSHDRLDNKISPPSDAIPSPPLPLPSQTNSSPTLASPRCSRRTTSATCELSLQTLPLPPPPPPK